METAESSVPNSDEAREADTPFEPAAITSSEAPKHREAITRAFSEQLDALARWVDERRRTAHVTGQGCLLWSIVIYVACDWFRDADGWTLALALVVLLSLLVYLQGHVGSDPEISGGGSGGSGGAKCVYRFVPAIARFLKHSANELEKLLKKTQTESSVPNTHIAETRRIFKETFERLIEEIATLRRRGYVNLVIGVVTTAGAIGWLIYMVVKAPPTFNDIPNVLAHYIPRVTTVVFIEVFAFFFLRLYRNGLVEVRYYQDQLTHLSKLEAAFEASLATNDSETKKQVINHIASTGKPLKEEPDGPDLQQVGEFIEKLGKVAADAGKKSKGE